MQREIKVFATSLASKTLAQVDMAVALLWHHDHFENGVELATNDLADLLDDLALSGKVNRSRLRRDLARNRDTLKGLLKDTWKIALRSRAKLDEDYAPLLTHRNVPVIDEVIPEAVFEGTRKYLQEITRQVNGCYNNGFFDGCAVLLRRLVEILLVESFEKSGKRSRIERNGELVMLKDILNVARNGNPLSLGRGSIPVLDLVKDLGDRAAHHRHYNTSKRDIDEVKTKCRSALAELLVKAGLDAK